MNEIYNEFSEIYDRLSPQIRTQVLSAYGQDNASLVNDAVGFELVQNMLDYEQKQREGVMVKETVTGEIVGGEKQIEKEKALAVAKKKDALLVRQEMSMQEWREIVEALYKSGFFKDLQSLAQAIAKAQCGRELGFPPFYSLNNFFILPGKPPSSSGQVMAALIKRSGYDYRTVKHDNDICTLKFFGLKGEEIGISSFTFKEADSVVMKTQYGDKKLTAKDNWRNYRYDMLFWRCMARGAREFCPDAIAGLYLKDEIDIESNEEKKDDSDLSAFKVETPQIKSGEEVKTQKTRKDILEELVKTYGKDKVGEIKKKLKIDGKLLEITDSDWGKFVLELSKKDEPKAKAKDDKKEAEKTKEKKEEETGKKELIRNEKKEILEGLKEKYGSAKLVEVKKKLDILEKVIDLETKDFNRYVKAVERK